MRVPRIRAATLALAALLCAPQPAHAVITNGANAIDILGQFASASSDSTPVYTNSCVNNSVSLIGFDTPQDVVFDTVHHRLFVSDYYNNRVLVFNLTNGNAISGKTPAHVLGRPDFTNCPSNGGTSQSAMKNPVGLAYDGTNDRLFVADRNNNRVLVFNTSTITDGMNAANVLGQADFVSGGSDTTQSNMYQPSGLGYDATNNRLFVADTQNNRVLVFNTASITDGMNAANVLGQADFVSYGPATTQNGMNAPFGFAFDATNNRLFVTSYGNNRVLVFNTTSITDGMNAANVLGQADFTSGGAATTQSGMSAPLGLALDSTNHRLFVAEYINNRVLVFNITSITDGMNAANVLGQADFVSNTSGTTQSGMSVPVGLAYDATNNRLFVVEEGNHRVMIFYTSTITDGMNASDLLGQYTNGTSTATVEYGGAGANNSNQLPNALGFNGPSGVALDAVNHRLFVSDYYNHRVLVYNLNTDNSFPDRIADYVLGQPDFTSHDAATTQSGMSGIEDLAFDAVHNRLFAADPDSNNRVLVYDTSSISNGMNAAYVLGQTDFVSSGGGTTQSTVNAPNGVAYDAVNDRLFVSDWLNNRVLVYNTSTITNGMNAANVLGHSGGTAFTNSSSGSTQSRMHIPIGMAFDPVNNRLFVADNNNNRVLVFSTTSIVNGQNATKVIGQTNFTNNGAALTQSQMSGPYDASYDSVNNRLFVTDAGNNRVLVFNAGPSVLPTNSASATNVLGQADFTSSDTDTTQNRFASSLGPLTYDPGSGRLFVDDFGNNRIMIFEGDTNSTKAQWDLIHGYE